MQAMGSDQLRALLRELNPGDRRLLECRIVDGWRYGEIAAHLGDHAMLWRTGCVGCERICGRRPRRSGPEASPEANRQGRWDCRPSTAELAGKRMPCNHRSCPL